MKPIPVTVTAALIGLFGALTCFAQEPSPPASTTSPSSASTPSQRDATRSHAAEAPATSASDPADASTPHQRAATAGKPQTMKECMDTQAAKNSAMSKADMTKACQTQMKMQKDHAHLTKAPDATAAPK